MKSDPAQEFIDDPGCVNCEDGVVMICLDDLCRGAGYCLSGKPDHTCFKSCPICCAAQPLPENSDAT